MARGSNLHCCMVIGNVKYNSGNQYKLFDSCIISYCNYCSALQYYIRQKTAGLDFIISKNRSRILSGFLHVYAEKFIQSNKISIFLSYNPISFNYN